MKKSLITNTHGFTSEALRKEERVIFDAFFSAACDGCSADS
ncbi:hypothetical protein SAMN04489735_104638 [Aneurinibacillus thermoaerophilus]|uniref:Uncharacterized protein n=1 Tax=Aneurinibacillus thermoaerophilus TaxID=143495 RepID=A0A1G8EPF0_ANETH|nr:hypothetical protein SAMN04489735_104638 [Aneurinibacillus thermoaerophilus]